MTLQAIIDESKTQIVSVTTDEQRKLLIQVAILRGYAAGMEAANSLVFRTKDAAEKIEALISAVDEALKESEK